MGDPHETVWKIDRYVQSLCNLGMDLAKETELEQGCEPGSCFEFLAPNICTNHLASNYYQQKIKFCRSNIHVDSTNASDLQLTKRIRHFVASKADLVFKLKGKEKLRSGIDYNAEGSSEAYSLFATQVPPLEFGMKISHCVRRAQMFEVLRVGDIIAGNVVGKRPFGLFVRITSLVHGRNLDFNDIDIQALCHKSELANDHKSREHFDPIDDFEINDVVRGVICSVSVEEERIAISFQSSKLPSEYRNIELGIVEDTEEQNCRAQPFDENREYNDYLEKDPGFANPTNVQTLIDVLGINTKPVNSLLRSCQQWSFGNQEDAASLRKQQSIKWSMDTTAVGVENFKSGSHEKAIKCFNHALQIYEDNAEALVARGALYANQNKLENAIKDFRQALQVHPKHHNACKYLRETLFEKAVRLKKIGNFREAIEVFKEVLNLDPSNTESQDHLQELQTVMTNQCAEEAANKQRKASVGSMKESHQFEHLRKLIKADPDLVRSSRKKKRKKKKKRKEAKRKKRTRHKKVSSDSTSTASEDGDDSDRDEWIEKESLKKPSPKPREKYEEKLAKSHGGQELKDEIKPGHSVSSNPSNEGEEKTRVLKAYSKERIQSWEIETEGGRSVENYRRSESNERCRNRQNEDRNSSGDRERKLEEWNSQGQRSDEASPRQKERTGASIRKANQHSPRSVCASSSRSRSKSQQRRNKMESKDRHRSLSSNSSGSHRGRNRSIRNRRSRSESGRRGRSASRKSRSVSGRSVSGRRDRSGGGRRDRSGIGRRGRSRSGSGRRDRSGIGRSRSRSGRRDRSGIGRRGRSRSGSGRRDRSGSGRRSRSRSGSGSESRSGRSRSGRDKSKSGRSGSGGRRSGSISRSRSRSRNGRRGRSRSTSGRGRSRHKR